MPRSNRDPSLVSVLKKTLKYSSNNNSSSNNNNDDDDDNNNNTAMAHSHRREEELAMAWEALAADACSFHNDTSLEDIDQSWQVPMTLKRKNLEQSWKIHKHLYQWYHSTGTKDKEVLDKVLLKSYGKNSQGPGNYDNYSKVFRRLGFATQRNPRCEEVQQQNQVKQYHKEIVLEEDCTEKPKHFLSVSFDYSVTEYVVPKWIKPTEKYPKKYSHDHRPNLCVTSDPNHWGKLSALILHEFLNTRSFGILYRQELSVMDWLQHSNDYKTMPSTLMKNIKAQNATTKTDNIIGPSAAVAGNNEEVEDDSHPNKERVQWLRLGTQLGKHNHHHQ